jgi:hypothetical protein
MLLEISYPRRLYTFLTGVTLENAGMIRRAVLTHRQGPRASDF